MNDQLVKELFDKSQGAETFLKARKQVYILRKKNFSKANMPAQLSFCGGYLSVAYDDIFARQLAVEKRFDFYLFYPIQHLFIKHLNQLCLWKYQTEEKANKPASFADCIYNIIKQTLLLEISVKQDRLPLDWFWVDL